MNVFLRSSSAPWTARAIGSSLLWGAIEFVALCRSRWAGRRRPRD